jgi:hypothetical protein
MLIAERRKHRAIRSGAVARTFATQQSTTTALFTRSQCVLNLGSLLPRDDTVLAQMALATATLVAQQVPAERVTVFRFAGRRHFEAFLHSLVCLLFWHGRQRLCADVYA